MHDLLRFLFADRERDALGALLLRAQDELPVVGGAGRDGRVVDELGTVVLAPITSTVRNFPTRYTIRLKRKIASVALDQIRTVSVERLLTKMTTVDHQPALAVLREMFAD